MKGGATAKGVAECRAAASPGYQNSNHACFKGEAQGPVLVPAISVELLLEGQLVNAVVDTGSPITIVSIDCLLDVLVKL